MPDPARLPVPNASQASLLRQFRNCAVFWILILVVYFVGIGVFLDFSNTPLATAMPLLLLMTGCVVIGAAWHAAATAALIMAETIERNRGGGTGGWST